MIEEGAIKRETGEGHMVRTSGTRGRPAGRLFRVLVGAVLGGGCTFAILAVRLYQVTLRPLLIGGCKFCPSCSEYAMEALRRHGLIHGSRLGVRRVLRCHPFSPGGIDPVPPPREISKL